MNKINYSRAFTLIELIVVIAIIGILSGIILVSVLQYIDKGKDASIQGYLSTLVPAGEVWYKIHGDSYKGFCTPGSPDNSIVVKNVFSQLPPPGHDWFCNVNSDNNQSWVACAKEPPYPTVAYCVDSRGVQEDMCESNCIATLTQCPDPASVPSPCHRPGSAQPFY